MPTLSQIIVYPIKSAAGISVERWPLDQCGLKFDRHWMLIDENHHFLSQRQLPKMALIQVRIDEQQLIVSAPGQSDLPIPLAPAPDAQAVDVEIWHDQCVGLTVSAMADQWFSAFLQRSCRLVSHAPTDVREVDPDYALPQDQTAFSDGFPMLLIAENSLNALNEAMALDFSMARFRPNLVVSDCPAYAEDSWRRIEINNIRMRLPKPCSRCAVPTIDPLTAETGKEPLTTLNRLRKWNGKVYFGQNVLHDQIGWIQIGDRVAIVESGAPQPPL